MPAACAGDAFLLEPEWIKVRRVSLAERPTVRIAHITDTHFRGDVEYLGRAVQLLNRLEPDIVCFTGDLIEDAAHLPDALRVLGAIDVPLFGVPGNWDYRHGSHFETIAQSFESTGGAWLANRSVHVRPLGLTLTGIDDESGFPDGAPAEEKHVLLTHFPAVAGGMTGRWFDLMLAGHSHGGQCRVPLFGAVILPKHVGRYQRGLYHTPAGPLYVNPGLGTWLFPVRFACRPEITLFEI